MAVTPDSEYNTCCVRSARRADAGVGRPERLVEGVGVQRLRPAQDRRQRLHRGPHDVDVRLLGGQGRSARLDVEAHRHCLRVAGTEPLAGNPGPHAARGPELGHLLEQVVVSGEEEREAWRELVERQASGEGRSA